MRIAHRETTRFFEIFDDKHAQPHTSRFTYRRAAFFNTLKSKMVSNAPDFTSILNVDGKIFSITQFEWKTPGVAYLSELEQDATTGKLSVCFPCSCFSCLLLAVNEKRFTSS